LLLLLSATQKRLMTQNCGNHAWLGEHDVFKSAPTKSVTVEYLTKRIAYVCHKFHIYFFLSVLPDKYDYQRFAIHKFCSSLKKI